MECAWFYLQPARSLPRMVSKAGISKGQAWDIIGNDVCDKAEWLVIPFGSVEKEMISQLLIYPNEYYLYWTWFSQKIIAMFASRRSFIQKTAIVLAGSSVFSKQLLAAVLGVEWIQHVSPTHRKAVFGASLTKITRNSSGNGVNLREVGSFWPNGAALRL